MSIVRIQRIAVCRLLLLIIAAGLAHGVSGTALVDPTFNVLKTRTGTYTNVTVTTRAESYIYIFHSAGMTSIRITDLPVEVRQQLGYATPDTPKPRKTNDVTTVTARELTGVSQRLKPLEDTLKRRWHWNRPDLRISTEVLCTLLGIVGLLYFFTCYCCHLICLKAKSLNSFLVWVPVLQLLPLLRAANMSGWWFFAFFVPGLNIVALVLWSLNIVKARGKHIAWAILLILPVTNLLAFLYLAFSSGADSNLPPPKISSKFQTRGLQIA
jgi:hypothetical protein